MRSLVSLIALFSLSLASACASGATPSVQSGAQLTEEAVRPGDLIVVNIWQEPDLSDTLEIDPNGKVVLPKLGTLDLSGATPSAIRARITDGYTKYLRNPSIQVAVLRRIQVTGAVKTPSLYHVSGTMTVGDAIALAGGVTADGNSKKVELIRDGKTIAGDLGGGTRLADTHLRSGDQLNVPFKSWLSRNGYLAGSIVSAVATIVAITVR
ncbi:MAG TPA: polysaccharide biosynthesis/export family protein [Gemmatimonadaceae bacterium]|jgi:polysaccharide export outer membrane protein|nr:polysaccharide biosynthesis/export family protein [Gemmatimonadaceae bacterium]